MMRSLYRLAFLSCLVVMTDASAHPFGGIGANRQASLIISAQELQLRYLVDLAEVPTMLAAQEADVDHDGQVSESEWKQYAQRWAQQVASKLEVSVAGDVLALHPVSQQWSLQTDLYGMSTTLRIDARFSAKLQPTMGTVLLRYRDDFRPDEKGWREVMLTAGPGAAIRRSTASDRDRSQGLLNVYMADSNKLPNETSAYAEVTFAALPASVSAPAPESRAPTPLQPAPLQAAVTHGDTKPRAPAPAIAIGSEAVDGGLPVSRESAAVEHGGNLPHQMWRFFLLGVSHIATGWDHLLFLFGLLLLSSSLMQTIKVATAFTVAHSLTLLLAASGTAHLSAAFIEPAIGLTIAYVGLANLLVRKPGHGVWLAFGFGLVHGFGFAGALAESLSAAAMPAGNWLISIASFNLGIEAFQVLLICLIAPILRLLSRRTWAGRARNVSALAVLGTGLGIFFVRFAGS